MSKRWSDYVDTGRTPMYSESFKRKVVAEVESELLNKDEARRKYNIGGKTTVLRWCRKYGKLSGGKINMEKSMPDNNELLKELEISMTETGDPRENAIAERINGIIKHEFGLKSPVRSVAEVKTLVEQAVLLYNNMRPHMSCQLQTPSQTHLSTSFANERGLKFICEPFFTISTNKSLNLFQDKTMGAVLVSFCIANFAFCRRSPVFRVQLSFRFAQFLVAHGALQGIADFIGKESIALKRGCSPPVAPRNYNGCGDGFILY